MQPYKNNDSNNKNSPIHILLFIAIPQKKCGTFLLSPRYHHNTYNHKQGKPTPDGMSIHSLTAVIVSLQSGDFRTSQVRSKHFFI